MTRRLSSALLRWTPAAAAAFLVVHLAAWLVVHLEDAQLVRSAVEAWGGQIAAGVAVFVLAGGVLVEVTRSEPTAVGGGAGVE